MSQYPKGLPEGLKDLFDADQRGEINTEEVEGEQTATVEEATAPEIGGTLEETNRHLANIVQLLKDMPSDIWDEIGR